VTNTSIYNNTVYIGEGMPTDPIVHSSWGGYADNTHFYNNIFYNLGTGDYDFAGSTNNFFDYNVFYGNHPAGEPSDAHKLTGDPKLVSPGSAGIGRETCGGYRLRWDSPCIDSGVTIPDSGGQDFWGNPVPARSGTDRGAHEFPDPVSYGVLEVHPNERAQGPGGGPMVGTAPWAPSGLGPGSLYLWKAYQFEASEELWIQVCGQCYSASQNAVGQADRLRLKIDGQVPPDVWGIMSGTAPDQWDGDVDAGSRLSLEFQPVGLTAGLHRLEFWADETPIIWWVKVADLRAIP
jgi:hypothetical protein